MSVSTSEAPLALKTPKVVAGRPFSREIAAHFGDAVAHIGNVAEPRDAAVRRSVRRVSASCCAVRAPPSTRIDCSLPPTCARPPAASMLTCRSWSLTSAAVMPIGLHARRIEIDADLATHAARALDLRHAGHGQQPLVDRVVDEPGQLFLGHAGGADRVVDDRAAVDFLAPDLRLEDALRQIGAHARHRIAHVGGGAIDRRADLEFDEDPAPGPSVASEMMFLTLPILETEPSTFCSTCVSISVGAAPGTLIEHLHEGRGDIRIERDRQADERDDAEHRQHREQHQREDRMRDRPGGDASHGALTAAFVAAPAALRSCWHPLRRRRRRARPAPPAPLRRCAGRRRRSRPRARCRSSPLLISKPVGARAGDGDRAPLELVVGADDQHVAALLIAQHGGLRQRSRPTVAPAWMSARANAPGRRFWSDAGSAMRTMPWRVTVVDDRADLPDLARERLSARHRAAPCAVCPDLQSRHVLLGDLPAHFDLAVARQPEQRRAEPGSAICPTSAARVSTMPSLGATTRRALQPRCALRTAAPRRP